MVQKNMRNRWLSKPDEGSLHCDRRSFLNTSIAGAAAAASLGALSASTSHAAPPEPAREKGSVWRPGRLIDTHTNLFKWPFRPLRYDQTDRLVTKLRSHGVEQAWAGSYEGLFCYDIERVNQRLAAECARHRGFLVPFGAVNPMLPDWEEDVRRIAEVHQFPGIRICPSYHNYDLSFPEFARLLELADAHALVVQLVVWMQDVRNHNPLMPVADVRVGPLPALLDDHPHLRVQLLNRLRVPDGADFQPFLDHPNVFFDTARLETITGLESVLHGLPRHPDGITGREEAPKLPAERIAVGTHSPYLHIEANLLKLQESDLTPDQSETIRYKTAERILGIA